MNVKKAKSKPKLNKTEKLNEPIGKKINEIKA